ncbi:MAG: flagellar basal body P-ring formation protein FlgA [Thermosipho sp. (in: Bacteria)]|nr:flagellar basal body P-ring formation protein FlgA [Thermosipho sp. (in: thermotogales)]
MKRITLILLLLSFTLLFSFNIEFKQQATVTTNVVTVFDIAATFTGIAEEVLKDISLVYLPDNSSFDLDVRYILLKLTELSTQIIATPTMGTVWVSNVFKLPAATLTVDIANKIAVKTILAQYPYSAEATITSVNGTITDHDSFVLNILDLKNGNYLIKFLQKKDGIYIGEYDLTVYVKNMRKVYIAKRKISFGEVVTAEDLMEVVINDYSLFGHTFNLEELPMISRKNIEIGEPVFREYLEKLPYVVKGQIIDGYLQFNGVKVSSRFQVLENGSIGDVIKAKNIYTNQIVICYVESGPKLKIITNLK